MGFGLFILFVFGFDVDAIVFVVWVFPVALAFEELGNGDSFAKDGRHQTLQDGEIGFVVKDVFGGSVETDAVAIFFHGFVC